LCVSSQVGCTLTCSFCHTGTQRLVRNLTAGEIVGQIMVARDRLGDFLGATRAAGPGLPTEGERCVSNIVMMGMGEPLYNFEAVRDALHVASDGDGLSLSKRRITLSTSGVIPNIGRTGAEIGCSLAISLHAVRDDLRNELVPLNRKYPIKDLLQACRDYPGASNARRITNVVMMGMGEPLYNFENVKKSIAIVADGDGLAVSKRRVTLSTAGVVPMIERAGAEIGSMLAISLHAARDDVRDVLVPLNKKYPIAELMAACRAYPGLSNARRITFEYVMLKGVNDSLADARALVKLIAGIPAKINLIPFNPWPGAPYECSEWEQIEKFAEIVNRAGYASPVRTPRGRDIMAACGQLKSASVKDRASARLAAMRSAELARMPG
jgi:23S rRNA (adenine2503-C2)-methyltransferase